MQDLSNQQKDLCGYGGTFGVMIAVTVLIQHFNLMRPHWITFSMIVIYSFAIMSFTLLAFQNKLAPVLLIISCILVFLAEALLVISFVFSVVVFILFVYTVIITVMVYMGDLPARLREKALWLKAEDESWQGRI